jgi:peptidoglycan DL-endopeptidase CwlO
MIRRRSSWLIGLFLCAALIAGCGSSSSTTSTQSSTPATTSSTPAAAATSTSTTTSTPSSAVPPANIAAAVAACKSQIEAQSTLPAKAKSKLEAVCEKAAKGDSSAVKVAAREICEEVIKNSSVPAGAAQEQALAACKKK